VQNFYDNGLAAAREQKNEKWGFIDIKGNYAIAPQFEEATLFSNGLAGVRTGDKWGFIDVKGNFMIDPKYDSVGPFTDDGYAYVEKDGQFWIIDREEKFIIVK